MKLLTFFALAFIVSIVSAGDPAKCLADGFKNIPQCGSDSQCQKDLDAGTKCNTDNKCGSKPTPGEIASCTNECTKPLTNEKVTKYYNDYADCMNGNIISTFATLLISIFFMLF